MPGVRAGSNAQAPRRLPHALRPVLRPAGGIGPAIAPAPGGDAGGDCPLSRRTHPAGGFGAAASEKRPCRAAGNTHRAVQIGAHAVFLGWLPPTGMRGAKNATRAVLSGFAFLGFCEVKR